MRQDKTSKDGLRIASRFLFGQCNSAAARRSCGTLVFVIARAKSQMQKDVRNDCIAVAFQPPPRLLDVHDVELMSWDEPEHGRINCYCIFVIF